MLKKQRQKLYMFRAVRNVCNDHQSSWSGVPEFVSTMSVFSDKIEYLDEQIQTQEMAFKGVTDSKNALRVELVPEAYSIARAIRSIAIKNGDLELKARMSFPESELERNTHADLLKILKEIRATAQSLESVLAAYNLGPEKLTSFYERVDLMDELITRTQEAKDEQKLATSQIDKSVREIDDLLEDHLDALVTLLKDEDPKFAGLYDLARITKKAGSHKKDDGQTGTPEDPETQNEEGDGTEQ